MATTAANRSDRIEKEHAFLVAKARRMFTVKEQNKLSS